MSRREEKIRLIEELVGYEPDVGDVLEYGKMSLAKLRKTVLAGRRRDTAGARAWGNRKCSCGKPNKECGDIGHSIAMLDLTNELTTWAMPKQPYPGPLHDWTL